MRDHLVARTQPLPAIDWGSVTARQSKPVSQFLGPIHHVMYGKIQLVRDWEEACVYTTGKAEEAATAREMGI